MKKRILSFLLALILISSMILVVSAASTATIIRAVDNNPNVGKKTFDVTVTFKTTTAAHKNIAASACDSSNLTIYFPAGTTKTGVSKQGASDGEEASTSTYYYYRVKLGKNFMKTNGDTVTITFTGLTALPYQARLFLAETDISRTYIGSLTITQNGSTYHTATIGGETGDSYISACKDTYPYPKSSTINLSTSSVTAPLSSTSTINYTVYAGSHRDTDLADGYLIRTNEGNDWTCKGYVISERLVYDTDSGAFSANGITLDSKNKTITIDGAAINSANKTYKFRIETTVVSGVLSGSSVSYLSNYNIAYSPVITVSPQPRYTVKYNANGGSGTMSNQSFIWGEAKNLMANAFTYKPTLTFDTNGGNALANVSVPATFAGWEDRSTTTYNGTTYKYTDFDAPGYAIRNNDVFTHSSFGNSIYNKEAMLNHYVNYGKGEYANGSESRAPTTGYIYAYPNGAKVSNLTTTASGTVNLYAKWKYGTTTLPTPKKAGYTFTGWKGDLMDIATLTNGMEISNTSKGTIGYNSGYAVTENLIPVIGGMTYTSNYEVCGLYSFDANGNFIKRESSYATTHTLSANAAYVRIEVNLNKGISFDQYNSGLTLTYTVPAGTTFPVGGNQTLTAQWTPASYTITFDAQGGTTSLKSLPVTYGSNQNNKIDAATNPTRTDYTFAGWYTQPEGGEQVYKVSNGSCLQSSCWSKEYDVAGSGAVWQYAGNITLYAHWNYTGTAVITFDSQGGTTTLKTLTVTYGSNTNNRLDTTTNPTKTGYTFDGWFDAPEGGTQVYKVSNGSCIKGEYWTNAWEVAGTGATWQGPKELTLYAQWIPNSYTVTFDANGGSVDTAEKSVKYSRSYGDLTTPVRTGYVFAGWYTAPEGGTLVNSDTTVSVASNHTLYARWTMETFRVIWKNYDGSTLKTDTDVPYNTTPAYNGATPAKPDDEEFTYIFSGWSPEPSPITSDAAYTAQFTAVPKRVEPAYTVTIPATAKVDEEFTITATGVVLNDDQILSITLTSDFILRNAEGVALPFRINMGRIENNAEVLSITGNGDKNTPLSGRSDPLTLTLAEDPIYAGTYTGLITFTIAVKPAGNP